MTQKLQAAELFFLGKLTTAINRSSALGRFAKYRASTTEHMALKKTLINKFVWDMSSCLKMGCGHRHSTYYHQQLYMR